MSKYQELSLQLQNILDELQSGNLNLDDAMKRYKEGALIIKQLENQLQLSENKVKKIKDSLD